MQIENNTLIDELTAITLNALNTAKIVKTLDPLQLNAKVNPKQWSVLECIEHLNLYGDFYLPEIEHAILSQKPADKILLFRSGLLGNYFAGLMQAKNGTMKKMKSPPDKNPAKTILSVTTIDRFIKQLERLTSLLEQARNIDLTKTKTAISLTKYIRLRLGDTLRFFVYHIDRHMLQAEHALQNKNGAQSAA